MARSSRDASASAALSLPDLPTLALVSILEQLSLDERLRLAATNKQLWAAVLAQQELFESVWADLRDPGALLVTAGWLARNAAERPHRHNGNNSNPSAQLPKRLMAAVGEFQVQRQQLEQQQQPAGGQAQQQQQEQQQEGGEEDNSRLLPLHWQRELGNYMRGLQSVPAAPALCAGISGASRLRSLALVTEGPLQLGTWLEGLPRLRQLEASSATRIIVSRSISLLFHLRALHLTTSPDVLGRQVERDTPGWAAAGGTCRSIAFDDWAELPPRLRVLRISDALCPPVKQMGIEHKVDLPQLLLTASCRELEEIQLDNLATYRRSWSRGKGLSFYISWPDARPMDVMLDLDVPDGWDGDPDGLPPVAAFPRLRRLCIRSAGLTGVPPNLALLTELRELSLELNRMPTNDDEVADFWAGGMAGGENEEQAEADGDGDGSDADADVDLLVDVVWQAGEPGERFGALEHLASVTSLELGRLQEAALPASLLAMTQLRQLALPHSRLAALPADAALALANLQRLLLDYKTAAGSVGVLQQLPALRVLCLQNAGDAGGAMQLSAEQQQQLAEGLAGMVPQLQKLYDSCGLVRQVCEARCGEPHMAALLAVMCSSEQRLAAPAACDDATGSEQQPGPVPAPFARTAAGTQGHWPYDVRVQLPAWHSV